MPVPFNLQKLPDSLTSAQAVHAVPKSPKDLANHPTPLLKSWTLIWGSAFL